MHHSEAGLFRDRSGDLRADLFDFDLPQDRIAQTPSDQRDASRLLVVRRKSGAITHHRFDELPALLPPNRNIFRNTVAVLKARLHGQRLTGGAVECLLLRPAPENPLAWWCLVRPAKRLAPGAVFFGEGFRATVVERTESNENLIRFELGRHESVVDLAQEHGEVPLPPYIRRRRNDPYAPLDATRYNTTYCDTSQRWAVAAPTAGLHFTPTLTEALQRDGHRFHDLNLHVGLGTFRPIQVEMLSGHRMHEEFYEIGPEVRSQLGDASTAQSGLAIGTTTLRAIEDYYRRGGPDGSLSRSWSAQADIFLYPPAEFHVPALLTNFHLPRSTLLCLVAAFLTPGSLDGISWFKAIYQEAIHRGYRFYSYGDAMLILEH